MACRILPEDPNHQIRQRAEERQVLQRSHPDDKRDEPSQERMREPEQESLHWTWQRWFIRRQDLCGLQVLPSQHEDPLAATVERRWLLEDHVRVLAA